MERRLRKFKINSEGVITLLYEQENESIGTWDEYAFKSNEPPLAELTTALQDLDEHLRDICELPETLSGKITILGVSISSTDNVRGVVITAKRNLKGSNGPMIINTPHFTEQALSETADASMSVFSAACARALKILEEKVFNYVDGERAQATLDFGGNTEEETEMVPVVIGNGNRFTP